MAKPTILKERGTGEVMYPQTLASLVQTADGGNVEEILPQKQDTLTTSDDLNLSGGNVLSLTDKAKLTVFCDLFNAAAGKHGYARFTNGAFDCKLNEIPLTYEEAKDVYDYYAAGANVTGGLRRANLKTCIPLETSYDANLSGLTMAGVNIKTLAFTHYYPDGVHVKDMRQAFLSVERVITPLVVSMITTTSFQGFYSAFSYRLEYILLKGLKINLPVSSCPRLELECFQYVVANAANTTAITITVHPDVYAKLTGDTTNAAAAALTAEELAAWQQVLTDAVARNISFATT